MIEELLNEVYIKFKLNFYQLIFKDFEKEKREASLTTLETFCVETIHALKSPTVNKFAEFLHISQANAAYKVAKLAEKGYIKKKQSKTDKREFHLAVTDKFIDYYNISQSYVKTVADRINKQFSEKDLKKFSEFLKIISNELMPEVALNS